MDTALENVAVANLKAAAREHKLVAIVVGFHSGDIWSEDELSTKLLQARDHLFNCHEIVDPILSQLGVTESK
jgi:hypothetical protein